MNDSAHGDSEMAGWSRRRVLSMVPAAAAGIVLAGSIGGAAHAATRPLTVCYVEVNSNNLSNVNRYRLSSSGRNAFDIGIIFAANINYNGTSAYLHLNERTQWTLTNAATQIRPLQSRGTKVLLSVLGNHQGAGFANFPNRAAAGAFAQSLADVVNQYGLDGIDFDDEYANYGANGTSQPNSFSFVYLIDELRSRLGSNKIISFYNIGPSASRTSYGGINAGNLMNYAWNPWYGTWQAPSISGMGKPKLGPAAINLQETSQSTAVTYATRTVNEEYGIYLTYNLTSTNRSSYVSAFTNALYGEGTTFV